jgi:hypothetical protein
MYTCAITRRLGLWRRTLEASAKRFSLVGGALRMLRALPLPAWGLIQASLSQGHSKQAATSARDTVVH